MATGATGTPTTNYSIPKYLTSADPPSGVGFNSTMDAIDTILKTQFDALTASVAAKPSLALIIALGG